MTQQNMKIWSRTQNEDDHPPLMTVAAISLEWKNMKRIFYSNKAVIYETDDTVKGLPVSLLAAVGPDSDLESVCHLCKENPLPLMLSSFNSQFENKEDISAGRKGKRSIGWQYFAQKMRNFSSWFLSFII